MTKGQSLSSAARTVQAGRETVRIWYRRMREGGCSALLHDARLAHHSDLLHMTAEQFAAVRRDTDAAIAYEQRPWARKRLRAVRAVTEGKSFRAAGRAGKVSEKSVRKWLRFMRQGGCPYLLRHPPTKRTYLAPMTPQQTASAKKEIAAALSSDQSPWVRKRLLALRAVIEGRTLAAAARAAKTDRTSVRRWRRQLQEQGCAALLDDSRMGGSRLHRMTREEIVAARQEIGAALAGEQRARVRKRLIAVQAALSGETLSAAASAAGAYPSSVDRWLLRMRQSGCAALLQDGSVGRPRQREMTVEDVKLAREEMKSALKRRLKWRLRLRLIAIDMVLSGRSTEEAAATAHVRPGTVRGWLAMLRHKGIVEMIGESEGRFRPRKLEADGATLRTLAANERNPRIRKRMLALAYVADGMGVEDAAVKVGLNRSTVDERIKRFQKEGLAGLQDKARAGRPSKLTRPQLGNFT